MGVPSSHSRKSAAYFLSLAKYVLLALAFSNAILAKPFPLPAVTPPTEDLQERATSFNYDVVIYGGTVAAFSAAIQCKRMNKTVAIVSPDAHLGGLTSSGLGWTDAKTDKAIGGITREFYSSVYSYYNDPSKWTQESRQAYLDRKVYAQPGPAVDPAKAIQWTFEPKAAEWIIEDWLIRGKVPVYRSEQIVRTGGGVIKKGSTISSIVTRSGKTFSGSVFIDTSYEGDLMAAAGIPHIVGRDGSSVYDESLNGKKIDNNTIYAGVDPYVVKGNSKSGLLKGIDESMDMLPAGFNGSADHSRLQSFNFRLTLTNVASNQVPFSKPSGYDPKDFELLLRFYEAGNRGTFTTQAMPNCKTDSNSNGHVSFDYYGGSYNTTAGTTYSESSYEDRAAIIQQHKYYQQGLLWTLVSNSRVPQAIRDSVKQWGLSKDEYPANGNWPYQIYVREARRMSGEYTITQKDVQQPTGYLNEAIIGMASYSIDSHTVRRVVVNGRIYDEGGFYVNAQPWQIPYGSIIPKKSDVTNLLNPITVSASHVAFGSLRMEPTYMILGQSAAAAASMAIDSGVAVQDIDRSALATKLKSYKQVLSL